MENKTTTTAGVFPQSIFTVAHTDIGGAPFNNHGRTLRLVVNCNVNTCGVQVRFANRFGPHPLLVGAASLAMCGATGVLRPDTLVPLTVDGRLSFELAPGQTLHSDTADFTLAPGDHFALNLYYPTDTRVHSGNWVGRGGLRSKRGNFSADPTLPGPGLVSRFARAITITDMSVTITSVENITALCTEPGMVVGCFGDSVTQQGNWTGPLEKLLHAKFRGKASLCNLGISGNRLLANSAPSLGMLHGLSGVARFERDLLSVEGLTHAVLALGANDVGQPGSEGIPPGDIPPTETYTDTLQKMADTLHQRGIYVIGATITPRWIAAHYTEAAEQVRQEWNEWIRAAGCFDAVFDFDRALRRADGQPGMREKACLPDGLHPSPFGGLLMAKSIDLSVFEERYHG